MFVLNIFIHLPNSLKLITGSRLVRQYNLNTLCLFYIKLSMLFLTIIPDELHSIPVQQMGNYQEYLKRLPSPLRELEHQPVRQHMFGNPFKVNKVRKLPLYSNIIANIC